VVAKRTVGFEGLGYNRSELAHPACQVCTDECNEFIAGIRINPNAVLKAEEAGAMKQLAQPGSYTPSFFVDIEHQDAPLPIPSYWLRDTVFPHENLLDVPVALVSKP